MAVRTECDNCGKTFSAPEDYLGSKIRCPNCGVKVAILSDDDRRRREEEKAEKVRWAKEQNDRIELIEAMDQRRRDKATAFGSQSYAVEFGTGVDRVRNFNPGALSRFRKLRALSNFLILSAYLLIALIFAAGGMLVYLYQLGTIAGLPSLVLCLTGLGLLTVFVFALFKFLGELSWLLADLGDHQLDVRNLLLDLRDNSDRRLLQPQPPESTPRTGREQEVGSGRS